ncbi:bifunctional ADP-dependent NAD(P)H-hydrate dehydratase/NAD(P)H-hydrate epimerase [Variovorax sp. PAMC 28711]|uniref:bifunctional ADP-dependent NAD(P)H-hydrate dehydratase/NAD(P)H-hydrate epimerase n=1 Tax=Variovorax sp. PAMC 28711 TaxID=1795631 RepID=UPI00078CDF0D|nr:bifunctional ADP-dependent NAD(P)H-hydrate dehydratase/NAD(P)H-hydrate epimerase [Variovorax sp. PAMC 28711]AMM26168.1 bifunctional ADP-dependent (S)-NAD(P)H-hydrate dehydratase/NAD(P)H-hydrate epimerase [Variovorax sp. PAMC 28711]
MQRITPHTIAELFDIAATRRIEQALAATLPAHALMQRAGLAVARLAMAIAPHARTVWIACGPGNNGGDGFEAAARLQQCGWAPIVTFCGDESRLPTDALASLRRARGAGVNFANAAPAQHDLAIDALLGIGTTRAPEGVMAEWLHRMRCAPAPLLSVDVPSGLNADTGAYPEAFTMPHADTTGAAAKRFCLSLLTVKPGLFTAQGRDAAGEVWLDNLDGTTFDEVPAARLSGAPHRSPRAHASHKGTYGDVAVIGGAHGMAGAALLAGSAALHGGAGRVLVGLLDRTAVTVDVSQLELMLRDAASLDLSTTTVVCGCGGGDAIRTLLPRVLSTAASLVLDADALNAIAADTGLQQLLEARAQRGRPTVLTPHPLEAARLLGLSAAQVQSDRLAAARLLAARFGVVVLKGSGTVIADNGTTPVVNLTGNGRLATAGTGDVLAGMVGAALAAGRPAFDAACEAVWHHGELADRWPIDMPLTAGSLARGQRP